jgi:hypothetical protein
MLVHQKRGCCLGAREVVLTVENNSATWRESTAYRRWQIERSFAQWPGSATKFRRSHWPRRLWRLGAASGQLLRSTAFFDGAGAGGRRAVLLVWIALGLGAIPAGAKLQQQRAVVAR